MKYPGRVIKIGEEDKDIVSAIYSKLKSRGIALNSLPGVFDSNLSSAVKLFQSLNNDLSGNSLFPDGAVGPITWGALFGDESVLILKKPASKLALKALAIAQGEVGKLEVPIGSNKGPDVEKYLKSTGLPGGYFWCMAFVHWCFMDAAKSMGIKNPFPKTAGVMDAWEKSKKMRIAKSKALTDISLVVPGAVFILDYGTGYGHTGFVLENNGGNLVTIEGNTNPAGSSNGIGVFVLKKRNIANSQMKGFILVP